MFYKKYIKNNNIVHEVELDGLNDIKNILDNKVNSIYEYNEEFINKFNELLKNISDEMKVVNRYQKEFIQHGNRVNINRMVRQNINCYHVNNKLNSINIYYDLINKYNFDEDLIINRFVKIYYLINKLYKSKYNVKFIPVLFLKAFNNSSSNEYVVIKINNLSIDFIKNNNFIINKDVSNILLPEIVNTLDIENKDQLNYNGYLLERNEKENLLELNNNNMLVDMFNSLDLNNSSILEEDNILKKELKIK